MVVGAPRHRLLPPELHQLLRLAPHSAGGQVVIPGFGSSGLPPAVCVPRHRLLPTKLRQLVLAVVSIPDLCCSTDQPHIESSLQKIIARSIARSLYRNIMNGNAC